MCWVAAWTSRKRRSSGLGLVDRAAAGERLGGVDRRRPPPRSRGSRRAAGPRAARPGSRAPADRGLPGALDWLSYSSERAARRAASARATPDWVAGRSASLRVLSVGVLAPASSPRSSSAPRAIPSADRGDRRRQQAEGRERVQRAALARRVGDQRGRARRRDRERRRPRCRGCRSPAARRPTRCRSPRPRRRGISTRRMSGRPLSSSRGSSPSWTTQPPISQSQLSTLLQKRQRPSTVSTLARRPRRGPRARRRRRPRAAASP